MLVRCSTLSFRGLLLEHGHILETCHLTLGRPFRLGCGRASYRQTWHFLL